MVAGGLTGIGARGSEGPVEVSGASVLHSGEGVPAAQLGDPGDLYIRADAADAGTGLYIKLATGWVTLSVQSAEQILLSTARQGPGVEAPFDQRGYAGVVGSAVQGTSVGLGTTPNNDLTEDDGFLGAGEGDQVVMCRVPGANVGDERAAYSRGNAAHLSNRSVVAPDAWGWYMGAAVNFIGTVPGFQAFLGYMDDWGSTFTNILTGATVAFIGVRVSDADTNWQFNKLDNNVSQNDLVDLGAAADRASPHVIEVIILGDRTHVFVDGALVLTDTNGWFPSDNSQESRPGIGLYSDGTQDFRLKFPWWNVHAFIPPAGVLAL